MATSKEVRNYDKEFAEAAAADAQRAAKHSSGSRFFNTLGGELVYDGVKAPGNQIDVVILDWTPENTFYEGAYNPKAPASPVCFAFEDEDGGMAPHEKSTKPQHDTCGTCPMNAWGSGVNGAKACKNGRRLMLVSKDDLAGPIVGLRVPPTSIKTFDGYIKSLKHGASRPCFGVYSRIRLEKEGQGFNVIFESLGPVKNDVVPTILSRREEAQAPLFAPYEMQAQKAEPAKPAGRKGGRF